jgi:hypothetical protein
VTPIIPRISYYDPSIGQIESPTINQRKKYGITDEPAGQLAYDMNLAVTYLHVAWGGQLWANGFFFDAVYCEGSLPRPTPAQLIKTAFDTINAQYGTKFTIRLVSMPWSVYMSEWRARKLPYFVGGWLANYPDAHDFAFPFMHSIGAFAKWQGNKGKTSFPNQAVDDLIESGIASTNPATRQAIYTQLQHYYVNFTPGFMTSQPTGRHYERDWVRGWYDNPIYPGNYIYDLFKATMSIIYVDVAITNFAAPDKFQVNFPVPDNPGIEPYPPPVSVTVTRLDTNGYVSSLGVVIGVSLIDVSGRETVLSVEFAILAIGVSYTANFFSFLQDANSPIVPGVYTVTARVRVRSGFAIDINATNDVAAKAGVTARYLMGDANCDGSVDMADISICIDAFMTDPTGPSWDIRCDLNTDSSIDMADVSFMLGAFMTSFDP